MSTDKPRSKISAATQRKRSAKSARRASPKPRGQPFAPGNPYAWVKGQSGNPAGTKGPKLSDLLAEMLGQPMPADHKQALADLIESGATIGQIIAFAAGLRASAGDLEALGVIADRTEGAPDQTIKTVPITSDDLAAAREKALAYEHEKLGSANA